MDNDCFGGMYNSNQFIILKMNYFTGGTVIIRGEIDIDISSWYSNFAAYGIRMREI